VVVDLLPHARDDFRRQYGQLHMGFEPEQITSLMAEVGMTGGRVVALPPEQGTKGPALFLATAGKGAHP
jgi:ArsR family transcriptional regulator